MAKLLNNAIMGKKLLENVENHKTVESLLESGASPNYKNEDGDTPLHIAVKTQKMDLFNILLTGGIPILEGCSRERHRHIEFLLI